MGLLNVGFDNISLTYTSLPLDYIKIPVDMIIETDYLIYIIYGKGVTLPSKTYTICPIESF